MVSPPGACPSWRDVLRIGNFLAVDGDDEVAADMMGVLPTLACWLPPFKPARSAARREARAE